MFQIRVLLEAMPLCDSRPRHVLWLVRISCSSAPWHTKSLLEVFSDEDEEIRCICLEENEPWPFLSPLIGLHPPWGMKTVSRTLASSCSSTLVQMRRYRAGVYPFLFPSVISSLNLPSPTQTRNTPNSGGSPSPVGKTGHIHSVHDLPSSTNI